MDRVARWLIAAAPVYLVVVLVLALAPTRLLGHDEAVYAVGARGLWSGNDADVYEAHRSIGMRALTAPGVALDGSERAVRLPFALIAVGYLAAIYALTRRWFGAPAAALAVAVQVTSAPWLWRTAEALSDLPSALALIGVVALCAPDDDAGRRRAVGRAIATGALAAVACYLRYASVAAVACIFVTAFVGDAGRRRWLVGATAVTLTLLVPLFWWSAATTGTPLGVLASGDRMANRTYYGEGIVFYLRTWPLTLAGPVAGAVAAIGLAVGLGAWRAGLRHAAPTARVRRLLASAALGQILLLGWRAHGESRFVFFAVTALVIVGSGWLAARARGWWLAVAAVALTAIPSALWALGWLDRMATRRAAFAEAAAAIRADAAGASCLVFSTEVPMTVWYTGCRTIQVDGWGIDPARATGADRIYLVEARGLPFSIGGAEQATRAALGWQPIACAQPDRLCVWRATRDVSRSDRRP